MTLGETSNPFSILTGKAHRTALPQRRCCAPDARRAPAISASGFPRGPSRRLGGRRPPGEGTEENLSGQRPPCERTEENLGGQRLPSERTKRNLGGRRLPAETAKENLAGRWLPSQAPERRIRGAGRAFAGRFCPCPPRSGSRTLARRRGRCPDGRRHLARRPGVPRRPRLPDRSPRRLRRGLRRLPLAAARPLQLGPRLLRRPGPRQRSYRALDRERRRGRDSPQLRRDRRALEPRRQLPARPAASAAATACW